MVLVLVSAKINIITCVDLLTLVVISNPCCHGDGQNTFCLDIRI